MVNLTLGFVISLIGAGWALQRRHLSRDGALGAVVLGTVVFGLGGWPWGLLLVAFFLSSSLLTHYRQGQKRRLAPELVKGGQRDLLQVLANGGWAGFLTVLYAATDQTSLFFAFLGALAAVNADTWSTEIGMLSPRTPRRITSLKPTRRGASGGVTLLGVLAGLTGGVFIGSLALAFLLLLAVPWLRPPQAPALPGFAVALPFVSGLAGVLASLFDSLLGAKLQGVYYCGRCRHEVEQSPDRLGHAVVHLRGLTWLDNDGVNLLSSIFGSLVALGLWWLL